MNNKNMKVGAVIGAGLAGIAAGASAVYLSEQKHRDDLKKALSSAQKQGKETIDTIKDKFDKERKITEAQVKEMLPESKKSTARSKD